MSLSLRIMVLEGILFKGFFYNSLIDVTNLRGIGKTTALINFAKEYGFGVILDSYADKTKQYRKYFDYEHIYCQNERVSYLADRYVIDEGVNSEIMEERGFNIVTGFVSHN